MPKGWPRDPLLHAGALLRHDDDRACFPSLSKNRGVDILEKAHIVIGGQSLGMARFKVQSSMLREHRKNWTPALRILAERVSDFEATHDRTSVQPCRA